MNIPAKLKEILSEDELKEVKEAFDNQVALAVESELRQCESEMSEKLTQLEQQINENHGRKLRLFKEKYDGILERIKTNYEHALNNEALDFKIRLAQNLQKLVEQNINKHVAFAEIKEAAKNKTASVVLNSLRKQLGIDSALMKESVAAPIQKVKNNLSAAREYIRKVKAENAMLKESVKNSKAALLIESKVGNLSSDAADHMRRMFGGKDEKFITEHFNYALNLYYDGKAKKRDSLRADAMKNRESKGRSAKEPKHMRDLIPEASEGELSEHDRIINEAIDAMNDM